MAEAVLTAWAVSDRRFLAMETDTPADARMADAAFAAALGVIDEDQFALIAGCGESADVVSTSFLPTHRTGRTTVLIHMEKLAGQEYFSPCVPVGQSGEEPADELTVYPPVREAALRGEIRSKKTELNAETSALLHQARLICAEQGETLSVVCVREFKRFLMIAQNWMAGGIRTALDWGMLSYVLPQVEKPETLEKLRPLCALLPKTKACLEKKHAAALAVERS